MCRPPFLAGFKLSCPQKIRYLPPRRIPVTFGSSERDRPANLTKFQECESKGEGMLCFRVEQLGLLHRSFRRCFWSGIFPYDHWNSRWQN
jgi:hypothetical protein